MTRLRYSILILLGLALAGCDMSAAMEKLAPAQDVQAVKAYVDDIRQDRFTAVEAALDPSIPAAQAPDFLARMATQFPAGDPKSVKIVGVSTSQSGGVSQDALALEYEFPDRWLLVNMVLQQKAGHTTILGLHSKRMAESLEQANRFSLVGKSLAQYLIFAMAVVVPIFIVAVLVLCIRTPGIRRRWLWVIFILFGFVQFAVDWTTGAWEFHAVYFMLLGAGFWSPLYGPVTISATIPIGAIWFLLRRRKLQGPEPMPVVQPAENG
jgi:outer membrane murein-binding lipoprotein Lpp